MRRLFKTGHHIIRPVNARCGSRKGRAPFPGDAIFSWWSDPPCWSSRRPTCRFLRKTTAPFGHHQPFRNTLRPDVRCVYPQKAGEVLQQIVKWKKVKTEGIPRYPFRAAIDSDRILARFFTGRSPRSRQSLKNRQPSTVNSEPVNSKGYLL